MTTQQDSLIDRISRRLEPPKPTGEDLANFREYMNGTLSPNGNRYGDFVTYGNGVPSMSKFENYIKWQYRLSQAEYDRLARLALIESLAEHLGIEES